MVCGYCNRSLGVAKLTARAGFISRMTPSFRNMDGLQSYSLEVITIDVKRKEAKVGVIERSTFEGDSGEPVEQAVIGALALRKEDDAWRISGIYF